MGVLDLPVNVPWKLIGVSDDMMDVKFGNELFPYEWRSSMALSIFEPKKEDLPEELCEDIVTFLKVTCTITGYQPTEAEKKQFLIDFSHLGPTEQFNIYDDILGEYFACYGALLNVAVFPLKTCLEPVSVDFAHEHLGNTRPNPYAVPQFAMVTFNAVGEPNNRILNITLANGQKQRVLDLKRQMVVVVPSTPKLIARVVHKGTPITLEAYREGQLVASITTGPEPDQIHELMVEDASLNRLVFKLTADGYLAELVYNIETDCVPEDLADYPHFVDFEPKTRDLYQGATEDGEVLSASVSAVKTDKSFSHTDSTETGVSVSGGASIGFASLGAQATHKWGETNQDAFQVQTDSSREDREKHATSTNLSQLYNLLTGYHVGTNRAAFLLLPRPHVLQPTDHRSFIQGLRYIEGIQDFFLIVARAKDIPGLCFEAFLQTSHFPERVDVCEPELEYDESHEDFVLTAQSGDDKYSPVESFVSSKYSVASGWVIDRRQSRRGQRAVHLIQPEGGGWDPGHAGLKDLDAVFNDFNPMTGTLDLTVVPGYEPAEVTMFNYQAISDSTAQISGSISNHNAKRQIDGVQHFARRFRVLTRSERPRSTSLQARLCDIKGLLITARQLCACYKSGDCPENVKSLLPTPPPDVSIVHEPTIQIDQVLLTGTETTPTHLTTAVSAAGQFVQVDTVGGGGGGQQNPEAPQTNLRSGRSVERNVYDVQPTISLASESRASRLPAMKELLRQVQAALASVGSVPTRRPVGLTGFLQSDYFMRRMKSAVPWLDDMRLSEVANLPRGIKTAFGRRATVAEALEASFDDFMMRTGLDVQEVARLRYSLLTTRKPKRAPRPKASAPTASGAARRSSRGKSSRAKRRTQGSSRSAR
jgi:hypothetical protein